MVIETAIQTLLSGTSAITALIGSRLYFVKAPQNVTAPYIVFSKISAPRASSHDGSSHLANPRFQFSIFGTSYESIKNIAAALQNTLEGYSGTMGGAGGVPVNGVFYEDETDLDFDYQQKLYGLAVDYKFWHEE